MVMLMLMTMIRVTLMVMVTCLDMVMVEAFMIFFLYGGDGTIILLPIIPLPSLRTIRVDKIMQGAGVIIRILHVCIGVMVNRK